MSEQRFTVAVGAADVAGVLHLPDELPSACVIACHGMGASKDSDKYLLLGRELPSAGLALARFDFRGAKRAPVNQACSIAIALARHVFVQMLSLFLAHRQQLAIVNGGIKRKPGGV